MGTGTVSIKLVGKQHAKQHIRVEHQSGDKTASKLDPHKFSMEEASHESEVKATPTHMTGVYYPTPTPSSIVDLL